MKRGNGQRKLTQQDQKRKKPHFNNSQQMNMTFVTLSTQMLMHKISGSSLKQQHKRERDEK
jgi:hypothetical protein